MAEYRNADGTTTVVERRGNSGKVIGLVLLVALLVVGVLFATGFWTADVKGGEMPKVAVEGGALPDVDVDSKEVVVGTTKANVDVPKIKTEKTTIDVPTVGVKDDNK